MDAHSRRVIGWAIADHMRTDLIQDALTKAMVLRGDRPATVIFHSDRGTQYASEQITLFAANTVGSTRVKVGAVPHLLGYTRATASASGTAQQVTKATVAGCGASPFNAHAKAAAMPAISQSDRIGVR
ncbi:DDE-type integrase/transposase/recombinase [Cryobacterium sp. HLT2-28]|uniref:DDE-type integrase/transposase/recombinase n=1 Tax=Cryobacterium sp. HLT2-28 TaxID=1259146 RepID=UPI00106C10A0|nr:hypothetical protein E3O48_09335 [Cryobacterium sp. HLT2-28]